MVYPSRSSRPEVFCKKGVLSDFAKMTGKNLYQGLFFNKVAGFREAWILSIKEGHASLQVRIETAF